VLIEVAFAEPDLQRIFQVELPDDATVAEAINAAQIEEKFPHVEVRSDRVGVWNQKRAMDFVLRDGDRVEIYRPLIADPKEVRRQRAAEAKS